MVEVYEIEGRGKFLTFHGIIALFPVSINKDSIIYKDIEYFILELNDNEIKSLLDTYKNWNNKSQEIQQNIIFVRKIRKTLLANKELRERYDEVIASFK